MSNYCKKCKKIYDTNKYKKKLKLDTNYNKNHYQKRLNNNPNYNKDRYKKALEKNPIKYKLNNAIRCGINLSLKGNKDNIHWEMLVNYKLNNLIKHLEYLFTEGMSWDNYGKDGWEIDHIIPTSWFKFESYKDDEFKQCWALCNLQPMWAKENRSKNNKYCGEYNETDDNS